MHSPLKTRHYRAQMIAPGIHSLVRMASLLTVLLLLGLRSPPAVALESLDAFPTSTLSIRTRQGPPEWFSVWIDRKSVV